MDKKLLKQKKLMAGLGLGLIALAGLVAWAVKEAFDDD